MLLDFILLILASACSYLLYSKNSELKQLQKYTSNLENDLLQNQIKVEELSQHSKLSEKSSLVNGNDIVTGLPIVQVFNDRALQTFQLSKRFGKFFGIMFLGIQDFDSISQKLGAQNTTLLIQELAKKLTGCVRQIDTLTRYNESNFIFLLPQLAQPETAAYVAQRVTKNLKDPFYIENREISLVPRIGISVYPEDADNLNTMIESAEVALNKAFSSKVPYLFHSNNLQKINDRELAITEVLNSGNLQDKILIYCLSQVNSLTGKIIGIKAIPYIEDPSLGLLAYDEYVKIAEKENKMTTILSKLLSKVIPQYQKWEEAGLKPDRLAINVSAQQIQNEDFYNELSRILVEYDFEPAHLALEVSANNFSENASSLHNSFFKFKKLGVQMSIGVFALGHLAIKKITQLPISYLKVDQRLIRSLPQYAENELILTALKDLSNSMELQAVAEGVDDETQKEMLEKLGFEIMQGKLFGEPKPIKLFMR